MSENIFLWHQDPLQVRPSAISILATLPSSLTLSYERKWETRIFISLPPFFPPCSNEVQPPCHNHLPEYEGLICRSWNRSAPIYLTGWPGKPSFSDDLYSYKRRSVILGHLAQPESDVFITCINLGAPHGLRWTSSVFFSFFRSCSA